jgi:FAD/FMN-containing dehydrogenase
LELVLSHSTLRDPLAGVSPFYMTIETSGSNSAHDQEKLSAFLEKAMSEQLIADGTIADNQQQFNSLWQLRERVAEAAGKQGAVYKVLRCLHCFFLKIFICL